LVSQTHCGTSGLDAIVFVIVGAEKAAEKDNSLIGEETLEAEKKRSFFLR